MWLEDKDGGEKLVGSYDLSGADLSGADLRGAYLRWADLRGADLRGADLRGADLREAYLRWADLSGADLRGADLREAYLRWADLSRANLRGADLSGADLRGATAIPAIPLSCPTHGEFTAWKKVNGKIVKLKIPEDARRSSATTSKCRCDKAFVLAIENLDGTDSGLTEIVNNNYASCTYTVGEMVYPDSFDENRFNECSHGIHFFIDRGEAERW